MPAVVEESHPRWLDVVDLERRIARCRECKGMNQRGRTQSAPGHGWLNSPVVMVGQSPCGGPWMKTGIPFTGGSDELLDKSFEKAGIEKHRVFITNVVHCHPPKNHASLPDWVKKCTLTCTRSLRSYGRN